MDKYFISTYFSLRYCGWLDNQLALMRLIVIDGILYHHYGTHYGSLHNYSEKAPALG